MQVLEGKINYILDQTTTTFRIRKYSVENNQTFHHSSNQLFTFQHMIVAITTKKPHNIKLIKVISFINFCHLKQEMSITLRWVEAPFAIFLIICGFGNSGLFGERAGKMLDGADEEGEEEKIGDGF